MADGLWFSVLGPVRAWRDDVEIELGAPQQRTVLAALLLRAGSQVSVGELAEMLWGGAAPTNPHPVIRTYVSRLRQLLSPGSAASASLIRTVNGGYVIAQTPGELDLLVFRHKVATAQEARHAGEPGKAAALLGEALALWQGEALSDIGGAGAEAERIQLSMSRLDTQTTYLTLRLELGAHTAIVPELSGLVDRYPLDERFRAMLMLALYRSDRQAQALSTYQDARARLADELGIDPGPVLRDLYERILRADPALLTVADAEPREASGGPAELNVLAQLPAGLPMFTGRDSELALAETLLPEPGEHQGAVVVVGTAGVGKSVFAVHWARRIAARFPDGQLYVNLRGFDPTGSPLTAADAVRGVLESLGIAPEAVPEGTDAMAALYRSVTAERRILLLLDNACAATQVRPLLPGNSGCFVLVTSRNELTGLLAIDGAQAIRLDVLPAAEALDMLARRIGARRAMAEPDAAREIVERCARLPLAIAIVAAHCLTHPGFALRAVADNLRDSKGRGSLNTFSSPSADAAADVRDVFSWSYDSLTTEAKRLFRLTALHPVPDVTAAAMASLSGLPECTAKELLAELAGAHLLNENAPGRYDSHDLLRTYAGELSEVYDSPEETSRARHRMFDHYLHAARTAALQVNPLMKPPEPLPSESGVILGDPLDDADVWFWFEAEYTLLMALADNALAHGFEQHAWQLAWTLDTFLYRSGRWQDAITAQTLALEAAERLGDRALEARSHNYLGGAYSETGSTGEALKHHTLALAILESEGDLSGQAGAHIRLGIVATREGRSQDCVEHGQRALVLYRQLEDRVGQAVALNNLGYEYGLLGDHDEALVAGHEALAMWIELGDRHCEANCCDNLGYSYHHRGEHAKAVKFYERAIALFAEMGDQTSRATVLSRLGDVHEEVHDDSAARAVRSRALDILETLNQANTVKLQERLRASTRERSGRF